MLQKQYPYYLGNKPVAANEDLKIVDKFIGQIATRDIHKAHLAWNLLDVGGVVIGDIPSWRADQMPYGGVKDSGPGQEGIRYTMEDMSEIKLMVLRQLPVGRES